MYNIQLLDEVYCDMKIINVEVRVISRAEGKNDNSYRDVDNFAYHRTDVQNALYSIFKAWSHSVRYTTRIL